MGSEKPSAWSAKEFMEYSGLQLRRTAKVHDLSQDEIKRLHDLEDFYAPLDNKRMFFDAFEALQKENERLKGWIESKRNQMTTHDAVTLTVHEMTRKENEQLKESLLAAHRALLEHYDHKRITVWENLNVKHEWLI